MLDQVDDTIVTDFHAMSKNEKAQFYAKSHNLLGKDLAMQICESVSVAKSISESKKLIDRSKYKDEIDLKEDYKNKPEQLKNILKNAPTMECPIRKVKLYADPDYEVVSTQEEFEERKRKLDFVTDRTVKAVKRAKPLKAVKIEGDEPKGEHDLTDEELKAIQEIITPIDEMHAEAAAGIAKLDADFSQFVTPAFMMKVKGVMADQAERIASIKLAIESKKCESFKQTKQEATSCQKAMKKQKSDIATKIKVAMGEQAAGGM
jgi:hypothetical protein